MHIAGITAAPQWLQNINPIVIILCGPLLAYSYRQLRKKRYPVTIPTQFATALIIIGLSLVILPIGIYFSDSHGFSNIFWAIASIALQGFAETSFTPIGFAMVGQLAPPQLRGFLVGQWLTCIGMGAIFAGYFSQIALKHLNDINPLITNANYSYTFTILGWGTVIVGVLTFSLGKIFWRKIN
jgi:POT family proton-dependent oligopeptide transporter